MRRVYLINLSFGLAGIERRFANLWQALRRRGVVFPILVVPSPLALKLQDAGLLPAERDGVIVVPEARALTQFGRLTLPPIFDTPRSIIRSRIASLRYQRVWDQIARDPG